ncbi:MAG: 4Fe-4S dicluster domain-containing protein [Bacteroidales bacterium]|nr:4Fe-4S dicluster domain-containing protein [Bacteroidales bacterium]
MLRTFRILSALLFGGGITCLLAGVLHPGWGWMARLQFLPAVLRLAGGFTLGNAAIVLGLLLLTWACGRIYCSVLCPLGIFQDLFIRLRSWLAQAIRRRNAKRIQVYAERRKKGEMPARPPRLLPEIRPFPFRPAHTVLRFVLLFLLLASLFVCGQLLLSLVAPYSAYGRLVRVVAAWATGQSVAGALLPVAGVTLAVILCCACLWGREGWCNTVCPVGTVLGLVSRHSRLQIRIDDAACTACGRCSRQCKASCIDVARREVDASRCVVCFDCLGACEHGALRYGRPVRDDGRKPAGKPEDAGRRRFLVTGGLLVGAATRLRAENHTDGGLAPVAAKQPVQRRERLVPPGAGSVQAFYAHCTACQLCVSNCPNGVLRPSTDPAHLLQPQMGYEKGWCRPECTACHVCPTGAIRPVRREEKMSIRIGTARVNLDLCFAYTGKAGCGNCERHCPTGAVTMVAAEDGKRFPVVAESQCIGCGACEYLCPSRPESAITVHGLHTHIRK